MFNAALNRGYKLTSTAELAVEVPSNVEQLRLMLQHDADTNHLNEIGYDPFHQVVIHFSVSGIDAGDISTSTGLLCCDSRKYVMKIKAKDGTTLMCLPLHKIENVVSVPISIYSKQNTFMVESINDVAISKGVTNV
jgi:hypothetical protein